MPSYGVSLVRRQSPHQQASAAYLREKWPILLSLSRISCENGVRSPLKMQQCSPIRRQWLTNAKKHACCRSQRSMQTRVAMSHSSKRGADPWLSPTASRFSRSATTIPCQGRQNTYLLRQRARLHSNYASAARGGCEILDKAPSSGPNCSKLHKGACPLPCTASSAETDACGRAWVPRQFSQQQEPTIRYGSSLFFIGYVSGEQLKVTHRCTHLRKGSPQTLRCSRVR